MLLKGDIVSFESRGTSSYFSFVMNSTGRFYDYVYLNGDIAVYLNDEFIINLDDYFLFESSTIEITKTGKQQLQFVVRDQRTADFRSLTFYIKNLKLLKPINGGSRLDYTKASLDDQIYYTATCSDGYVLSGNISYDKEIVVKGENYGEIVDNTDDNIQNDMDDNRDIIEKNEKNPNTIDIIVLVLILLCVSGIVFVVLYKKVMLKYT